MKEHQIENLTLLMIGLLLAFAIWVVLYHPEWLMWFFTYQG